MTNRRSPGGSTIMKCCSMEWPPIPRARFPGFRLLMESETRRLLQVWNDTSVAFPRNLTVHKLIEQQMDATPDSVAVVFEDSQLTYAELNRRSNQLAHYLRKLGVKPGSLVAVFVERGLEMIVALLGTMKAGGAYVPLDPTFPPERLRFVLGDAKASIVLTQDPLTKGWTFDGSRVVRLDSDWGEIAKENGNSPEEVVTGEDLAYVLYTSGSTGQPKGVEIPHRAVVNLLQAMLLRPGLKKSDTFAAITTLSFDISGLELYLPLCTGAKLAIVSRETGSFGLQLIEYLKKVNATAMQATPVTWKQLIEAGWDGNPPLKVLCGGEAFPRELANQLTKRSISVWNMYGPTETTIWSATDEVETGDGPVPIGKPIANTQFHVLDEELQLVPIGIPGDLYIAGDGLARGYLNQPALTASRFVPNPFSRQPGARMYKTGDLVLRRPNGDLEFLGRTDDQIKLRGFRIELGEIQSCARVLSGDTRSSGALAQGYSQRGASGCLFRAERRSAKACCFRPARFSACEAPRLHDSGGVYSHGGAASHSQRKNRPPRAARSGLVGTNPRFPICGSAHPRRGNDGADLG